MLSVGEILIVFIASVLLIVIAVQFLGNVPKCVRDADGIHVDGGKQD